MTAKTITKNIYSRIPAVTSALLTGSTGEVVGHRAGDINYCRPHMQSVHYRFRKIYFRVHGPILLLDNQKGMRM
jgi:hypothetical protein